MASPTDIVLQLEGVHVGVLKGPTVIDAVTLDLRRGEIVCLVGESGSGKTTTALTAFGYCAPNLSISEGKIAVGGKVVEGAAEFARIRGTEVSYVPQNPATALNPSMRIVDAIADTMRGHTAAEADRHAVAVEMLKRVGLPSSAEFGQRYPHQLSGGQQQRVCIAAALASKPKVIVLDEPTTGLDVVTQARILNELLRLRNEEHVAMLYVTHDLAVAAQIADRIVVMYGGYIVEEGPASEVLRRPRHPYTRGLMAATPDHIVARVLEVMSGGPIDIADRPPGCPFTPRCPQKVAKCETTFPDLELKGPDQPGAPRGRRPTCGASVEERHRGRRDRNLVRDPQERVRCARWRIGQREDHDRPCRGGPSSDLERAGAAGRRAIGGPGPSAEPRTAPAHPDGFPESGRRAQPPA